MLKSHKDENLVIGCKENMIGSEGLPIGIQVATVQYEDEKCLAISKRVDEMLQKHKILQPVKLQAL